MLQMFLKWNCEKHHFLFSFFPFPMLCHMHCVFTLLPLRFICLFLTPSPTRLFPFSLLCSSVMLNARLSQHQRRLLYLLVDEEQQHGGSPGEGGLLLGQCVPAVRKRQLYFEKRTRVVGIETEQAEQTGGDSDKRVLTWPWKKGTQVVLPKQKHNTALSSRNVPGDKNKACLQRKQLFNCFY